MSDKNKARYCPLCGVRNEIDKNPINRSMVRALIAMRRLTRDGHYVHYTEALGKHRSIHFTAVYHWGLLERMPKENPKDNVRGYYRISADGLKFLRGEIMVKKYCLKHRRQCLGFEGPYVDVHDAIGEDFDLEALLARAEPGPLNGLE